MPKRRRQIEMTPSEIDDLLSGRHTMSVATMNWDGTVHLTAMWYGFHDGAPALWTYGKSQKVRNLERDPRMSGLVEDGVGYAELRGVELVGTGEIIRDHDVVLAVGLDVYSATRVRSPTTPVRWSSGWAPSGSWSASTSPARSRGTTEKCENGQRLRWVSPSATALSRAGDGSPGA